MGDRKAIHELLQRPDLLKIVVQGLGDTIAGYTQTSVSTGAPGFVRDVAPEEVAVGGLIRFEGEAFTMELFLGFSKSLFCLLYENMFHSPVEEITPENHDLAGEVLNIAFGAMDPKFRALGVKLISSLPEIFSGEKLGAALKQMDSEAIVIPFTAQGQKFVVNLYSAGSLRVQWRWDGKKAG